MYRHGRSVSNRYLVLYAFARDPEQGPDPRLGLAVPRQVGGAVERNRIKRRLREAFERLSATVDPTRDYVLIVRPGLAEAAESRGFAWLTECVEEVFGQSRTEEATPA